MGICAFLSLYRVTKKNFMITFHDDGSLDDATENYIKSKLNARIVRRAEADASADIQLKDFPGIKLYRQKQVMALKLIDVRLYAKGERIAYIDSDILFFKDPVFVTSMLDSQEHGINYFNRDIANAYVDSPENIFSNTGDMPLEKVNAGFWVMNKTDIDLEQIERWLQSSYFKQHAEKYVLDQTIISMLAAKSKYGAAHMPEVYDVSFNKDPAASVCKHYVGRIRHGFELEGLQYLMSNE